MGAMVVLACGCSGDSRTGEDESSKERLLTESSENISITMSENGKLSYIFKAPLVEGYTLAKEPYREFRKGIDIVTFKSDSLSTQSGDMRSNYAIYYENRKLWECVGDVEVRNSSGRELYSQQLFWNTQTKRIYSNVDTKIVDTNSGDIYYGEGFESDEDMEEWTFRKMTGRMRMEMKSREERQAQMDAQNRADSLESAAPIDSLNIVQ